MSKGKVLALVVAICVTLGLVFIGACAGLLYMGLRTATASVEPTIGRLLAAIDNDTFADTYESETAAEFRKTTSKEKYEDIGKAIAARLGPLKSKSLNEFHMRQFNMNSFVDVSYKGTFEKGSGTINARLKKEGGDWKLVSLHVNSPVFEQDVATAKCPKCGAPHARSARFCPSCGVAIASGDDQQSAATGTEAEK